MTDGNTAKTDWVGMLDIRDAWATADFKAMARVIAKRLPGVETRDGRGAAERNALAERFQGIADDEGTDATPFNAAMAALYDWGDGKPEGDETGRRRTCLIRTTG